MSPSRIEIAGWGAVSPAGWSSADLLAAVESGEPLSHGISEREGRRQPVPVRRVPKPAEKYSWLRQPRLRRTSPIARFCVAAALEAIGESRMAAVEKGEHRLGVIYALVNGCVNYSQRFFREVLEDPSLASPIVFPETVFNAPASHLSAMLGANAINYTVVGDSATFVPALELATDWIADDLCDSVVIIGGEEFDWLSAEAFQLFSRRSHRFRGSRRNLSASVRLSRNGTHGDHRSRADLQSSSSGRRHQQRAQSSRLYSLRYRRFVRQPLQSPRPGRR